MITKVIGSAERQRNHVKRRKAAGLMQSKVWVHPDEAGQVRDYAAKRPLTKKALKEVVK